MDRIVRGLPLCVVSVSWLAGCGQAGPAEFTQADRDAIAAVTEAALTVANESGDWAEYASVYYTPEVVFMPPNGPAIQGRETVAASHSELPPLQELRYEQVEMDGAGDLAFVYGRYFMTTLMPEPGGPVRDNGKYMEIWRRQADGSWRVAYGIFNSDLPLPELPDSMEE